MMLGAHLAGTALAMVTMAIHHGLCHVLGGTLGVPHGVANAIMLPHAMRFNLPVTAPQLAHIAEAMGIERAGRDDATLAEAAIRFVTDLIRQIGLPQRLRDVDVAESAVPQLAQTALASSAVRANPQPVTDAAQVAAILWAAF
jgi:alcohol dehydrogenase